jgi:DNA topoisomerase IB
MLAKQNKSTGQTTGQQKRKKNMEKQTLTIRKKSVYGVDKYYPACEKSKIFAKLLGQQTLTEQNLKTIACLDYELELEQDELEIFKKHELEIFQKHTLNRCKNFIDGKYSK